ncbi:hypothetical protein AB4Z45_32505 [Paenibacillus sp. MCAF9]|uniref:hypothetical protein n=1 Tax=Paenibacillus sp. TAF43_2 TaxID=3233069 RepID=UPI003F991F26
MIMIYQLHLSFALLLLCVLAITAVLIYPLLLDSAVMAMPLIVKILVYLPYLRSTIKKGGSMLASP